MSRRPPSRPPAKLTLNRLPPKVGRTTVQPGWRSSAHIHAGRRAAPSPCRRVDGQPFRGSFMALGDGTHKLPVRADVRRTIGKEVGDSVTVHLLERLA